MLIKELTLWLLNLASDNPAQAFGLICFSALFLWVIAGGYFRIDLKIDTGSSGLLPTRINPREEILHEPID